MQVDYFNPMTPQKLGEYAEGLFVRTLRDKWGKRCFIHRFPDTKDVRNRAVGESVAWIKKQPSDFLVVLEGVSYFGEIKATENRESFSLSQLRPEQVSTLKQLTAADGDYSVMVLRRFKVPQTGYYEHLWYELDRDFVLENLEHGIKKLFFKNLGDKLWNLGNAYLESAPI